MQNNSLLETSVELYWVNINKDQLQKVKYLLKGMKIIMNSKQRAYLRSIANTIEPIFQIGKGGISENLISQLSDALEARELIKISVLETAPDNAKSLAECIATKTNSSVVQVIGSKITLYRPRKKDSKIILP